MQKRDDQQSDFEEIYWIYFISISVLNHGGFTNGGSTIWRMIFCIFSKPGLRIP